MSFKTALAEHIRARGPMPVAEFMRQCVNYYYMTRDPFGASGDFITAPEISQIFGELLGAWLATTWTMLGKPKTTLCELGPGRGTLMKDALRITANVPGFHDAVDVLMVEASPTLRALQEEALRGAHPRITWQEEAARFPAKPLLLVANEFFDALPIMQYVGTTERMITAEGDTLHWQPKGRATREESPASIAVMSAIAKHIKAHYGVALVIDYGYEGGTQKDTLQAVSRHSFVDPLATPGEADLTAHVDFAGLKKAATLHGLGVSGTVEQGTFLRRLGAELRAEDLCKEATPEQAQAILSGLARLTAPDQMGSLFKVMAVTSTLDNLAGF